MNFPKQWLTNVWRKINLVREPRRVSEIDRDALPDPIAVARGAEFLVVAGRFRRRCGGIAPVTGLVERLRTAGGAFGHGPEMGRVAARRNGF